MEACSKSDIGLVRESNQDACYYKLIAQSSAAWAVVCDGMGGTAGGNTASSLAVESITKYMAELESSNLNDSQIKSFLQNAALDANNIVFKKSKSDEALKGMGTTVVLALVLSSVLHLVYAGDSRAYIINNEIHQLTTDHSVVQEMISSGEITPLQASGHPQKNIITRALGVGKTLKLDYIRVNIKSNDAILICTDGLTNHVENSQILSLHAQANSIDDFARELIEAAKQNGGLDNITALVIRL